MILDLRRLPILETERLRLAPLAEADAEAVFTLLADPEALSQWEAPEPDDPDVVAKVIRGQVEAMAGGGAVRWAMRTLAGGVFVGCFHLTDIDRRRRRAEVGFMLGREAWREGFAKEALQAVIAYAAGSGLKKLSGCTRLGDRRSEAILEDLSFKKEGLLRGQMLEDGERRDCRIWSLLL